MSEHAHKTLLRPGTVVVGIVGLVLGIGLTGRGGTATYEGRDVDHWFQLLGSASETDRDSAENAIDALGPRCLPFLLSQVKSRKARLADKVEAWVRQNILHQVRIGSVCGLMAASEAETNQQRLQKAFEILGDRATSFAPRLRRLLHDSLCRYEAGVSLLGMGKPGLKQLEDAFQKENVEVRQVVASVLAEASVSQADAAGVALKAIKDPDGLVRHYAAHSLGRLMQCSSESVRALAIALEDPDSRVRYISVYALKRFGVAARPAMPALEKRMEDAEENIRKGAAEVLSELEKMTVTNEN